MVFEYAANVKEAEQMSLQKEVKLTPVTSDSVKIGDVLLAHAVGDTVKVVKVEPVDRYSTKITFGGIDGETDNGVVYANKSKLTRVETATLN